MNVRPSILCPIDLSEASAGALRYAAAIAERFVTRLIVLAVRDPRLTAALDPFTGARWSPDASEGDVATFVTNIFAGDASILAMCESRVEVGTPALEILRVARERSCDLIVMSSHGLSGGRSLFFGSTTERVLRATTVPVLVTPSVTRGAIELDDTRRGVGRVVVPVDLSPASRYQTQVVKSLVEALDVPPVFVHVIEPVTGRLTVGLDRAWFDSERRALAEEGLNELVAVIPSRLEPETLVVHGDPAEEVANVVRQRRAGLVVMGLHGSTLSGPRMGSVTHRLLCLTHALVLALPPKSTVGSQREMGVPATLSRRKSR